MRPRSRIARLDDRALVGVERTVRLAAHLLDATQLRIDLDGQRPAGCVAVLRDLQREDGGGSFFGLVGVGAHAVAHGDAFFDEGEAVCDAFDDEDAAADVGGFAVEGVGAAFDVAGSEGADVGAALVAQLLVLQLHTQLAHQRDRRATAQREGDVDGGDAFGDDLDVVIRHLRVSREEREQREPQVVAGGVEVPDRVRLKHRAVRCRHADRGRLRVAHRR